MSCSVLIIQYPHHLEQPWVYAFTHKGMPLLDISPFPSFPPFLTFLFPFPSSLFPPFYSPLLLSVVLLSHSPPLWFSQCWRLNAGLCTCWANHLSLSYIPFPLIFFSILLCFCLYLANLTSQYVLFHFAFKITIEFSLLSSLGAYILCIMTCTMFLSWLNFQWFILYLLVKLQYIGENNPLLYVGNFLHQLIENFHLQVDVFLIFIASCFVSCLGILLPPRLIRIQMIVLSQYF